MAQTPRPKLAKSAKTPAEDLFFHPGQHPGLALLAPPDWTWSEVPLGRIAGLPAGSVAEINTRIHRLIDRHFSAQRFRAGIAFNTVPALVTDLYADGSHFAIGGKWLLNGASGTRIRNRLLWQRPEDRVEYDKAIIKALAQARETAPDTLPLADVPDRKVDYVVDCRNFFAFYHFITESLPQLCLAQDLPNLGRIVLQSAGKRHAGFVRAWVEALFPEWADRVVYATQKQHFDQAYIGLNTRHLYYQSADALMPSFAHLGPADFDFHKRIAARGAMAVVGMNGYDITLARLRARALARAADVDTRAMPRRFWVSRPAGGPRDRRMAGQDDLVAELKKRGFAEVYFEDYSPLEQIALMQQAEVMISYHGAGFANMLFAGRDTFCLEMGTLQTALYRWADFMPHAHVSGCRYVSFFADLNQDDPADLPNLRSANLVPVSLPAEGRDKVLAFVDAITNPAYQAPADVLQPTAQILQQTEDDTLLDRVLHQNATVVAQSADLLMVQARRHRTRGDLRAAVRDMQAAWALDQSRPFLLEQLILTAESGGRWAMVRDLRAEHLARFADRHPDLVRRIRQMRHRKRLEAEAQAAHKGA